MRFARSIAAGGFVQPVAGIDPGSLRLYLPVRIREHVNAAAFLAATVEHVEAFADMAGGDSQATADEIQEAIKRVGKAAHVMRNALAPLASGSDAFESLLCHYGYLRARALARSSPASVVAKVPRMAADAPDLGALLARMADDLRCLRAACEYTAERIVPLRSMPSNRQRMLVRWIAESYRAHFGKPPPRRSWFADDFMKYIGSALGVDIGWRVVRDGVDSMT